MPKAIKIHNSFSFRTKENMVKRNEKLFADYMDKVDDMFTAEIQKIIMWFEINYGRETRSLEWKDGMGTCFWVYNGDILDDEAPEGSKDSRIFKVLHPCKTFLDAFVETPHGVMSIPSIGDFQSERFPQHRSNT